ncbi:hypothetical protein [Brevundimonas lenta]|uniref:Uncharacterized protein n=1 Tax=Brevundimonas lenta TaxID=424796 RepID=A0A7W6NPS5_9CAUL|nr:hypothetical protein [Brevundimonas lenta]MBB4082475.1 hypothetical protein [Brevundimonas lenta]
MGLTVLLAFLRGGALEKQVAGVVGAAWIASALVPLGGRIGPAWLLVAIDVGLLLYLLYQAAFAKRFWPVVAAGFQLLIVATHATFALRIQLEQWGYFTAYYLWSWGVLACIAVGALSAKSSARDA